MSESSLISYGSKRTHSNSLVTSNNCKKRRLVSNIISNQEVLHPDRHMFHNNSNPDKPQSFSNENENKIEKKSFSFYSKLPLSYSNVSNDNDNRSPKELSYDSNVCNNQKGSDSDKNCEVSVKKELISDDLENYYNYDPTELLNDFCLSNIKKEPLSDYGESDCNYSPTELLNDGCLSNNEEEAVSEDCESDYNYSPTELLNDGCLSNNEEEPLSDYRDSDCNYSPTELLNDVCLSNNEEEPVSEDCESESESESDLKSSTKEISKDKYLSEIEEEGSEMNNSEEITCSKCSAVIDDMYIGVLLCDHKLCKNCYLGPYLLKNQCPIDGEIIKDLFEIKIVTVKEYLNKYNVQEYHRILRVSKDLKMIDDIGVFEEIKAIEAIKERMIAITVDLLELIKMPALYMHNSVMEGNEELNFINTEITNLLVLIVKQSSHLPTNEKDHGRLITNFFAIPLIFIDDQFIELFYKVEESYQIWKPLNNIWKIMGKYWRNMYNLNSLSLFKDSKIYLNTAKTMIQFHIATITLHISNLHVKLLINKAVKLKE